VTLVAGLLALNRLDTILLSLPFLLVAYWRMHDTFRGAGKTLAIGFAPFLAWEVFAIVYYGFPFPCTAYSKLGSGIASSDLRAQGALYFLSQLTFDPTSLLVIAGALVLLLVQRERRLYPLGLGIVLYLAYVVRIGGDFMAGRFFTLPLLASALLLALLLREYLARKGAAVYLPAAATIAAGLLLTSHPTLGAQVDYALVTNSFSKNVWDERGVADERAVYAESSSILRVRRDVAIPDDGRRADGQAATAGSIPVLGRIGVSGFFAPPNGIIVDGDGLADALVARLPLVDKKHWRIGHFWRHIPDGYIDSIKQGRNLITDPATAILYDRVKLVVSGPIWSWARWKEIARLNFGLHRPSPAQPDKRS
jgi:arabinofuranosyltransferase